MALQEKVRTSVTNGELTPESCSLTSTQTDPDTVAGRERERDKVGGRERQEGERIKSKK